jgi:hypothetical protein
MIPPALLAEADAAFEKLVGFHGLEYDISGATFKNCMTMVEWLFTRLCEMSEGEWTVELTNAALDAGSRPISDPLNTTVAFVNGARHQHSLDQAALLKARDERRPKSNRKKLS